MAGAALARAQKNADAAQQTIVWVDESAFYLLPAAVRTYAPCGKTPILDVPLTRDHLSVISALTADGRLLLHIHDHAIRGPDVVRFVQHLLRHLSGKLLVIWDGAPIHRCTVVTELLAAGAAARVQLERLPSYAPELNPAEGIWRHLKRVKLRNLVCHDRDELRYEIRLAVARLRHQKPVLLSCISHAGVIL